MTKKRNGEMRWSDKENKSSHDSCNTCLVYCFNQTDGIK